MMIRVVLAMMLLVTSAFATARAAAQEAAANSPALQEAARLNEEVVKLYAAGKYAEALPVASRVVEIREKELGRGHALVAGALINLAAVEGALGKGEEAKAHYRRAASALEKAGEGASRSLINALEGEARLEPNALAALDLQKRILALKEKTYGADSPEVASTLFPAGHLSDLLGRREEAAGYFRRFVEVSGKRKGAAENDVGVAYLRLRCIANKEGKGDDAIVYAQRAKEVFDAAGASRAPTSAGVINGKAISKPQPVYPAEAKRARAEGTIVVEMLVGENGVPLSACAVGEGHPALKAASEFAAYNARFTPTTVDGKPVKVSGVITYRYVLR